jgi:hypothetical protein
VLTSHNDRQAFLALDPKINPEKVTSISQGVDLDYFHPDPSLEREPNTLVLSGKMSYHANIAMAQYLLTEIMPIIWAEKPETAWSLSARIHPIDYPVWRTPCVNVTGTVKDIRPYLL